MHALAMPETGAVPAGAASAAPGRRRLLTALLPLIALQAALWVWLLLGAGLFGAGPNGRSLGVDFAVFMGAAQTLKDGGNPYDYHVLFRTERSLLARQGLPMSPHERLVRAGNPPLFYWALEPLTSLPFQAVALAWIGGMLLVAELGFLAALRFLGWRHRLLPSLAFLLMPPVVLGACYGNIHAVVFAAIAGGPALMKRSPFAAGMLMGLGWLKPQLAFPLILLVILFHAPNRKTVTAGLLASTGALLALTVAALGPNSIVLWVRGLMSWSHDVGLEPNIASLAGLYTGWAPYRLGLALGVLLVLCACVLTAVTWWRHRESEEVPPIAVAWLWVVWLLATPFAHFPDEILLAVPVLALIGRDGRNLGRGLPVFTIYLLFFSLLLFPITVFHASPISLSLLVVAGCLVLAARDPRYARDVGRSRLRPLRQAHER